MNVPCARSGLFSFFAGFIGPLMLILALTFSDTASAGAKISIPHAFTLATPGEAQQLFTESVTSNQNDEDQLKVFLKRDLSFLIQRHTHLSETYLEFLRRTALQRLAETAFLLAAMNDKDPSTSPLFKISIPRDRFPGLKAEIESLHEAMYPYHDPELRRSTRIQTAQLLILNAMTLRSLEQHRNELLEKRRQAIADKKSDEIVETEEAVFLCTQAIGDLFDANPILMLLLLPAGGPPRFDSRVNPDFLFEHAGPDRSIYGWIMNEFDQKRGNTEILMELEKKILNWIPSWNKLILNQRFATELDSLKDFFKYDRLRELALEQIELAGGSERFRRFDHKKAVDFGYASDDKTGIKESDNQRILENIETAAFFASAPVGAVTALSSGINGMMNRSADQVRVTAAGFTGWNHYETIRLLRSTSCFRPMLVGLAHAIVGFVMRTKLDRWLRGLYAGTNASLGLALAGRLQAIRLSAAVAAQGGLTGFAQASGSALKSFVAKNPKVLTLAVVNSTAGLTSMIYSSIYQRGKSVSELLKDPNFWRDSVEEVTIDSLMAFFATRNKPFLDAAFVLASVSALSGVLSQTLPRLWSEEKQFKHLDLDRVLIHSAVLATYGCWKFRSVFAPLRDKTEGFFRKTIEWAASKAGTSAAEGGGYFATQVVSNSAGFGVLLLSNFAGTFPWLLIGRSLEENELEGILERQHEAMSQKGSHP